MPYPAFGIVSLLDDQAPCLPPGIEDTYAVASWNGVQTTTIAASTLLAAAGGHAQAGMDTALRAFVGARLRNLQDHLTWAQCPGATPPAAACGCDQRRPPSLTVWLVNPCR